LSQALDEAQFVAHKGQRYLVTAQ